MSLPLLISVPHAGLDVPREVASINLLTKQQIAKDGDEGAALIFALGDEVAAFVTTAIARAYVDLNRAEDDRRPDGVVKIHTIWQERIYATPLSEDTTEVLLNKYYRPYHVELAKLSRGLRLGMDCHTMAAIGPPIGPLAGQARPWICLSNADGTCPDDWLRSLADRLNRTFNTRVSLNFPFKGGYIIRSHAKELPWIQVEISRAPFFPEMEKRQRFLDALSEWCAALDEFDKSPRRNRQ